jgi:hypothetical protein
MRCRNKTICHPFPDFLRGTSIRPCWKNRKRCFIRWLLYATKKSNREIDQKYPL